MAKWRKGCLKGKQKSNELKLCNYTIIIIIVLLLGNYTI